METFRENLKLLKEKLWTMMKEKLVALTV